MNTWLDLWGLIVKPQLTYNSNGSIRTATAIIILDDLGTGTATNSSSRKYARILGVSTDDAGHIIGKQLGGSGGKAYIFPQNPSINRGEFAQFEGRVANLVFESGSVSINISFEYDNGGTRPSKIHYEATSIDGKRLTQSFNNPCN